jgi:hypothetical protein
MSVWGAAGLLILRSYFWLALVFVQLTADQSLVPAIVLRSALWLDARAALAPLVIAILVLIPVAQLYKAVSPVRRGRR